jgi:hypothetical protein
MKKFLLGLILLLPLTCPLFGQATTGFHRTAVALSRATQGVTAQVVPNAKITVTNTSTGAAATIYSDAALSSQITPSVVTADNSGNYGYYLPLNYCVTETITSPGQGTQVIPNICVNSVGGNGCTVSGAANQLVTNNGATGCNSTAATADSSGNVIATSVNATPNAAALAYYTGSTDLAQAVNAAASATTNKIVDATGFAAGTYNVTHTMSIPANTTIKFGPGVIINCQAIDNGGGVNGPCIQAANGGGIDAPLAGHNYGLRVQLDTTFNGTPSTSAIGSNKMTISSWSITSDVLTVVTSYGSIPSGLVGQNVTLWGMTTKYLQGFSGNVTSVNTPSAGDFTLAINRSNASNTESGYAWVTPYPVITTTDNSGNQEYWGMNNVEIVGNPSNTHPIGALAALQGNFIPTYISLTTYYPSSDSLLIQPGTGVGGGEKASTDIFIFNSQFNDAGTSDHPGCTVRIDAQNSTAAGAGVANVTFLAGAIQFADHSPMFCVNGSGLGGTYGISIIGSPDWEVGGTGITAGTNWPDATPIQIIDAGNVTIENMRFTGSMPSAAGAPSSIVENTCDISQCTDANLHIHGLVYPDSSHGWAAISHPITDNLADKQNGYQPTPSPLGCCWNIIADYDMAYYGAQFRDALALVPLTSPPTTLFPGRIWPLKSSGRIEYADASSAVQDIANLSDTATSIKGNGGDLLSGAGQFSSSTGGVANSFASNGCTGTISCSFSVGTGTYPPSGSMNTQTVDITANTGTGGAQAGISYSPSYVTLAAGQTYTLSVWMKTDGTLTAKIFLGVSDIGETTFYCGGTQGASLTSTWTLYTLSCQPTSSTSTGVLRLNFIPAASSTGNAYINYPVFTQTQGFTTTGPICSTGAGGYGANSCPTTGTGNVMLSISPVLTGTPDASGATQFKLPVGSSATTAANGEFKYDTTGSNWHAWVNGADALMIPLASGFVSGHCGQPTSTGGSWVIADAGAACGSGGSGDTITSPNSTLNVGGTSSATTLDVVGAAGKILAGATPTLTYTPILGVDNSNAGTLQLANGSANAHTIWGSAATTSNTILGPATVPTTLHLMYCVVLSTTCTLTDTGYAYNSIPNGDLANSAITIAGTSVSLGGSTSSFPSPGAIGGTTPAPITGTTITANTSLTINGGTAQTGTQGTDNKLLTAGTISGTSVLLCTDASGGATTSSCPSTSLPSGVLGQSLINTGAGATTYSAQSPTLAVANGGAEITTSYTLLCDSATVATGIQDRGKIAKIGTGGSVTIPDLAGTGCTGFYGGLLNDTSSGVTISRQTSDTFTIFGPTQGAPLTAQTSFTLPAGSSARFEPDAVSATVYDVVVTTPAAQVYPSAGVPNSTGSAWGTSYTVGTGANNLVQLNISSQLPAVSGVNLTGLTATQVGLANVTNDVQTKAAIVPNTAPSAGQILAGNAGGTAYAPVSMSGGATMSSTGAVTLGNPGASTLGGIESLASVSHKWINQISTSGVPSATQPACGDLSDAAASCNTDATNASNISTGNLAAARLPSGILSCTEVWGGSGTSFALTSGDDAISNNSCYNDSGSTRTITAVKCRSDSASNTTTVNPTFGSAGTGTAILSGALTCGSSYAFSSSGTVTSASWTTGTGIDPAMGGTLTGTSIAMIVEYHY